MIVHARPNDWNVLARYALARPQGWLWRWYILVFCFGPTAAVTGVYFTLGIYSPMLMEQAVLAISTFASLWLLSDRPLLNPVQTVVFLFHHWFGLGPAACAAYFCATGKWEKFDVYYHSPPGTLLIVAAGLPLYAVVGALVLHRWPEGLRARFLEPAGTAYSMRTIGAFLAVGGGALAVIFGLQKLGVQAFESVNYLGGTVTTNPVLAIIASLTSLASGFALYGFLHAWFTEPAKVRRFRWLGLLGIAALIGMSLFSGSKGTVVFLVLTPLMLHFTLRQRIPWVALASLAFAYLFFLQPFVDNSRMLSEVAKITTPEQRKELFLKSISSGAWSVDGISNINMESPFRYMYEAASRVTPQVDDVGGPWGGRSLSDGVSSILPRAVVKDKADSNMGNFFARELDLAHPDNLMHNVTLTIPFEIVGNYGWVAGVLSFGVMAAVFACGSAWLLSKDRLATHPLTPMAVLMLLKVEASCGQMVNAYKGMLFALIAAWGIWHLLGRRL